MKVGYNRMYLADNIENKCWAPVAEPSVVTAVLYLMLLYSSWGFALAQEKEFLTGDTLCRPLRSGSWRMLCAAASRLLETVS